MVREEQLIGMASGIETPRRKPWEERNPIISGVLAYLVPGLGHFYQGRWFKGTIYFVGILGTFFGGLKLGEGAVVYNAPTNQWVSLNYLAQVCVGLPALPGAYQAERAKAASNRPLYDLDAPLSAPFTGRLIGSGPGESDSSGGLVGTIELHTDRDRGLADTRGRFVGTLDGKPIELELSGGFFLDRPISAGWHRRLECNVARRGDQHPNSSLMIRGGIPRPFVDAYAAPPDAATLQDLHGRLGKVYDLALAFTMIAGLLNVLAIWDALEGPAYGFGDEPPPSDTAAAPAAAVAEGAAPRPPIPASPDRPTRTTA